MPYPFCVQPLMDFKSEAELDLNQRSQIRRGVLAPLALTTCIPAHDPHYLT